MKEKEFVELFKELPPQASEKDCEFMKNLTRNIDAVENVRKTMRNERRNLRRASIVAVMTGFGAGVVSTLLFSRFGPMFVKAFPFVKEYMLRNAMWAAIMAITLASSLWMYSWLISWRRGAR